MNLLSSLACAVLTASIANAQDFYDIDVLRTVDLQFDDPNWKMLLEQNYASQTNILADMTVEGVVYTDVGVRIRGNTSYTALPPTSEKFSLNISVDFVDPDQEVMGVDSLNFNNAFSDPTFCREVVYTNILSRWIPSGRANHVIVRLNGENWGVYANVQQYGKKVLGDFFEDNDGLRIKCANNPFGPGLQYEGTNPANYSQYEIKDDGGLLDPVAELIAVCNALDNAPPALWEQVDELFAIDPSIWTVALENLFTDDDSYVNKGCDFVMYQNPVDGRMHLHQTDGNETWTDPDWEADFKFNQNNKPFLNNTLSEPILRARYFAHLRALVAAELDPVALQAEFTARRNLIDAAVQADPKKIYSYAKFQQNFSTTVTLGGGGPFGNATVVGLLQFINDRLMTLNSEPEFTAVGPVIQSVAAAGDTPGQPVFITAAVSGSDPVLSVTCFYRPSPDAPYLSVDMLDDGLGGDGLAADGVFGVQLPIVGDPSQVVQYYVRAIAQNTFEAQSFLPVRTEMNPQVLTYQGLTAPSDIVINEFLAQNTSVIADEAGSFEDYVELYNKGAAAVDLSGMYMSDSFTTPTEWQIPAGTTLAPGQTLLIWADEDLTDGPLHADFKLGSGGDDIGLWDTDGLTQLAAVSFGPQEANVSTGLLDDGGALYVTFTAPTPNALNKAGCGYTAYDQLDPLGHPLDLAGSGTGAIGSPTTLTVTGLAPGANCVYGFSLQSGYVPVPSLNLIALIGSYTPINAAADGLGTAVLPLTIPAEPLLVGLDIFVQSAGQDAGLVVVGSNAVRLTICP